MLCVSFLDTLGATMKAGKADALTAITERDIKLLWAEPGADAYFPIANES